MAHSFTEKELIDALTAKGGYMIRRVDQPISAPPTVIDMNRGKMVSPKGAKGVPPPPPKASLHQTLPNPAVDPLLTPIAGTRNPYRMKDLASLMGGGAKHKVYTSTPSDVKPPDPRVSTPTDTKPPVSTPNPDDTLRYKVESTYVPKVPFFSGDDQKGDVTYIEWRFEIRCLMKDADVSSSTLVQAIRRSLRGTARSILVTLGENATVSAIMAKLDNIFGDVSTGSMVMQEFFNCYQKPDESVTSFGCRLENLLQLAAEHGSLDHAARNDFLRHKFWTSLASDKLKSQTRHKYDSITNFDELLREIRSVEKELQVSHTNPQGSKKAVVQPVMVESQTVDLEQKFDSKLQDLEKRLDSKFEGKFNQILQKLDSFSGNNGGGPGQSSSYAGQSSSYQGNKKNYNKSGKKYYGGKNFHKGQGGQYQKQGNQGNLNS